MPMIAIHIIPENDTKEHLRSGSCWCQPLRDNGIIFTHHALDLREKKERQTGDSASPQKTWNIYGGTVE